jgi:hypothetical protein
MRDMDTKLHSHSLMASLKSRSKSHCGILALAEVLRKAQH